MVLDLMLECSERYWLKRAGDFDKVGTPACAEIAKACRAKASLCRHENADEWADLLAAELGEVA
ncbi:hypothetical protein [Nocardioides sp.]|uniref:hypothetical protein n=1 Tax=Nocardioides sp. TaxID=35761 RepID=UPI00260594D1|nr:hypothetical protein [Nocardioides sp.]